MVNLRINFAKFCFVVVPGGCPTHIIERVRYTLLLYVRHVMMFVTVSA